MVEETVRGAYDEMDVVFEHASNKNEIISRKNDDDVLYFCSFREAKLKELFACNQIAKEKKRRGRVMTFARNLFEMRHFVEAPQCVSSKRHDDDSIAPLCRASDIRRCRVYLQEAHHFL